MKNSFSISVKKTWLEKFNMTGNHQVLKSMFLKSFCLLLVFSAFTSSAQETSTQDQSIAESEYIVKGTVIDEDNLPLGGVNVFLKETKEGIVTDLDGNFEFPRALEVDDILVFSYIGYNPQEYKVKENESHTLEVDITFDLSNISLMGAVEVEGIYRSKRNIFQKIAGLFK